MLKEVKHFYKLVFEETYSCVKLKLNYVYHAFLIKLISHWKFDPFFSQNYQILLSLIHELH